MSQAAVFTTCIENFILTNDIKDLRFVQGLFFFNLDMCMRVCCYPLCLPLPFLLQLPFLLPLQFVLLYEL